MMDSRDRKIKERNDAIHGIKRDAFWTHFALMVVFLIFVEKTFVTICLFFIVNYIVNYETEKRIHATESWYDRFI